MVLRKLKNLIKPASNEQCCHIIPWVFNNSVIVQKAAEVGWHPSNPLKNGINLDKSVHNGWDTAHRVYSENLQNHLENNISEIADSQQAKEFLNDLQDFIKLQLQNGKKLDEVVFD